MGYSTEEIEALVAEIERSTDRVAERAANLRRDGIRREIGAGLGHVVVNQNGDLLDLHLDRSRVRDSSERALADHLIRAIHGAQNAARGAMQTD